MVQGRNPKVVFTKVTSKFGWKQLQLWAISCCTQYLWQLCFAIANLKVTLVFYIFSRKAMTALGRLIGNFDGIFLSVCTEMFAYCCRVGYCVDFKSRYFPIICAVRSKWRFHPGNFFHLDRDWTCCIWQQVYTIFVDHWWQVRIMNHQSGASFRTEAIFRVIALVQKHLQNQTVRWSSESWISLSEFII